jgi:hypothetical protein
MAHDRVWGVEVHIMTLPTSRFPEPIAVNGVHLRMDSEAILRQSGVVVVSCG